MPTNLRDAVIRTLLSEPEGLSAPDIVRRLRTRISQPTLWRLLDSLRSQGRITVEGRARATRYRLALHDDVAARRSLQMHRAVARRLARDPQMLDVARQRLIRLRSANVHGVAYHDRWQSLIEGPIEVLLREMTEDSEQGRSMRKESPFSALVTPAERLHAFSEIR